MNAAAGAFRLLIAVPLDPDDPPIGGIASFVRGVVKHAPADIDVELVGTTTSAPLGRWRQATLEGRSVRHLPVARSGPGRGPLPLSMTFVAGMLRHRRHIPAQRVLQFHRPASALPLLARRDAKTRVVHMTVNELASSASDSAWRRLPWFLRIVERFSLPRMDTVYVVNETAAESYRKHYPAMAERIQFLPNWVDDDVFVPPDSSARASIRAAARDALGLAEAVRLVLLAGRLERVKDPILAVEAVAQLTRQRPVHLVVAGDGPLKSRTISAASSLAVPVSVLGTVPRATLAWWMSAADALIVSSVSETGPTVALEALATGLPVAAVRVGTIARILTTCSDCGALADERSKTALAAAIDRVLALDPDRSRRACAEAALPYSVRAVVARLYEDIRRLGTPVAS